MSSYINKALCKMIGYTKEEMIGKQFADFLHPDDKKDIVRKFLGAWRYLGAHTHTHKINKI